MQNHDLKILRDKINGSIPHDEDVVDLQEQWNQMHAEMEALKAEDERNYVECRG